MGEALLERLEVVSGDFMINAVSVRERASTRFENLTQRLDLEGGERWFPRERSRIVRTPLVSTSIAWVFAVSLPGFGALFGMPTKCVTSSRHYFRVISLSFSISPDGKVDRGGAR